MKTNGKATLGLMTDAQMDEYLAAQREADANFKKAQKASKRGRTFNPQQFFTAGSSLSSGVWSM